MKIPAASIALILLGFLFAINAQGRINSAFFLTFVCIYLGALIADTSQR